MNTRISNDGSGQQSARPADIVVIGGAVLDIKCRIDGKMQQKTSNVGCIVSSAGGVARNVSQNLAQLGVSTSLISVVGHDENGVLLVDTSARAGVDVSRISRSIKPTARCVSILDDNGELVIAVAATDIFEELTSQCIESHESHIATAEFVVADTNLHSHALIRTAQLALSHKARLVVVPVSVPKARRAAGILSSEIPIYLLAANREELAQLVDAPVKQEDQLIEAARMLHRSGARHVVIGLGSDGLLASNGTNFRFIRAHQSGVVDVTGAGDAALAAMLWALKMGRDFFDAAYIAQAAAALTVASLESVSSSLTRTQLVVHTKDIG